MLTDLSFLDINKPWPPEDEDTKARLQLYEINKKLFEGYQAEVYNKFISKINRIIVNFKDVIDFAVIVNMQKKITLKIADLLFQEPPLITAGEIDSQERQLVNDMVNDPTGEGLIDTSYTAAIDVSRYGDGLYYVYKDEEEAKIDVTVPSIWFPVVSPENVRKIQYHVLAWVKCDNPSEKHSKRTYKLHVQIHDKGSYIEREYLLMQKGGTESFTIKELVKDEVKTDTGLSDFAIIQISNLRTSDRVTGIDDYVDINTIIYELMVRISQISRILDKHASPNMQGPSSALEKDPITGEWKLSLGEYFKRNEKTDPEIEYVTWDGKLDSAFKEIEILINLLYVLAEMSPALLGDFSKIGTAVSGSALRFRMISPLSKVKRLKKSFSPAIKRAISLASEISGRKVEMRDITVNWQDGLPNDPVEDAKVMQIRTGNKQTMSVERAIKEYDTMTDESVALEIEAIQSEQAEEMPMDKDFVGSDMVDDDGELNLTNNDVDSELSYNGAQIESALSITEQVALGTLAAEAAVIMLSKFLRIDEQTAQQIVNAQKAVNIKQTDDNNSMSKNNE